MSMISSRKSERESVHESRILCAAYSLSFESMRGMRSVSGLEAIHSTVLRTKTPISPFMIFLFAFSSELCYSSFTNRGNERG